MTMTYIPDGEFIGEVRHVERHRIDRDGEVYHDTTTMEQWSGSYWQPIETTVLREIV